MKDTPTIAEAIQAARESTRIAELDLLRAMNAGTDSGTVAGKLVAQLLDSDVRLITVIGKRVSQIADTLQALEEPSPMAEDMAQYRRMLGRVQRDTQPSRIPALGLRPMPGGPERDVKAWATAMIEADLAYNITDDPGDITLEDGKPMFTERECRELRDIVTTFSEEEAEEYLAVLIARVHEQASEPPLEQPEPPPAPSLSGSRCQFRRDGDGCQCNVWQYSCSLAPAGDRRHIAKHVHHYRCRGKVPGTNPAEPCDGDEGHSGPCFQIPF